MPFPKKTFPLILILLAFCCQSLADGLGIHHLNLSESPIQLSEPELQELGSTACPNQICPGLGNTFYLPRHSTVSAFTGGREIFLKRELGTCASLVSTSRGFRGFKNSESSSAFFSMVGSESHLSGRYNSLALTFETTFSSTTGFASALTDDARSTVLDIATIVASIDFRENEDCWSRKNLDPSFLQAFEALPGRILDPQNAASWDPYLRFLQNWGSHVMIGQTLGSRFQQWESTRTSSSASTQALQAKGCANVEGVGKGGWSVATCAAYDEEERRKALRVETNSTRNVVGGTQEARTPLLAQSTVREEDLTAFLESADKAEEAILQDWRPIWQLLFNLFQGECDESGNHCENYQRALNLEAAYEGWMAVGCSTEITNQLILQRMQVHSINPSSKVELFGCWARKLGCTSNSDCSGHDAFWRNCYCYGKGCVDLDTARSIGNPARPDGHRNTIRATKLGSSSAGVNLSCEEKAFHCACNQQWGERERWLWLQ